MLRDKEIRAVLVRYLEKMSRSSARILEEVRVHNGNAIADVVAFHKEFHCYEIKGESDSVQRLVRQASYYSEAFPKVTAVVTQRHVSWVVRNLPCYWGIIVAREEGETALLRYHRKASTNPDFSKEKALMSLWKEELIELAAANPSLKVKKSHTRQELAALVGKSMRKGDTVSGIRAALLSREARSFEQCK